MTMHEYLLQLQLASAPWRDATATKTKAAKKVKKVRTPRTKMPKPILNEIIYQPR